MIESYAYDIIKEEGIKEGILETVKRMVLEALDERFGVVPVKIVEKVRGISNDIVLNGLHRRAVRCSSLDEFENILERTMT
ncbi:hypothetical protein FJZ31_26025 [Candidatus Poribacteria bacterium]|nr:hypothetical protein [Candidatus Poribacteria bacterium]